MNRTAATGEPAEVPVNWTDEEFLKMIEEEFQDVDWDNLPDLESSPSHWEIHGMQWRRLHFLEYKGKPARSHKPDKIGFGMGEFASKEEAEAKLESMRTDPDYTEERLTRDWSDKPIPSQEFTGPLIFDTVKVTEHKSAELITLHLYKDFLDRIKKGEKVFPIALP